VLALATLKQVMEEKARLAPARRCLLPRAGGASGPTSRRAAPQVTASNVDISKVAPHYHLYTQAEVEAVIERL